MKRCLFYISIIALICFSFVACQQENTPSSSQTTTSNPTPSPQTVSTPEPQSAPESPSISASLPEQIEITVTREGMDDVLIGTLAISNRVGYAVYVLPDFTFYERDGVDTIESDPDVFVSPGFMLQMYEVDTSKPVPDDENNDMMYSFYRHVDLGDRTIEIQFNYPNTSELVEGGLALLNAMADTICSAK